MQRFSASSENQATAGHGTRCAVNAPPAAHQLPRSRCPCRGRAELQGSLDQLAGSWSRLLPAQRYALVSGTIVTRLPPTAYEALSSAFKDGMKQYPPAEPQSILNTCFDFTGQENNVTIPSVALVLDGGAVVDLDPNGIILSSCLAFAATDDDRSSGIIGNVQQRTFEVLYDVGQSVFGFRPGVC
ncbi:aspartyl protease family protein At5g10770-like [Brachypodium distachyon]|uniref:aspartyl protease family protein At5g10770-like n=1 Tax=Brachypodium distachyon TaxID=15368 RepID=UPI000D0DD83D|nr:aspartyl protease family protein At5g10770-like [Brachypodium distachyon]|eukprot:XP_024317248.1 aspartyl protease family protein At5g10770-like [Brachypodium distachyon]